MNPAADVKPPDIPGAAELMRRMNAPLYFVGGLVRNLYLGLPVSDVDICSALRPEQVMDRLAGERGFRVIPKAPELGTVEIRFVPADGQSVQAFEHTTFRGERYRAGGTHRPREVRFSDTLEEDAFRRDFTVNALYLNMATGELADPTGGIADLRFRRIRTTSADPSVILRSDALRLLRMARFASELGFTVERHSFDAAKDVAGLLKDIAAERIRDELNKILLSDIRYPVAPQPDDRQAHLRGLNLLDEMGALTLLIPELEPGRNFDQQTPYHAYDVLRHLLMTCAYTPPAPALRLAGLLHDICKPEIRKNTGKMYGHEIQGAETAKRILGRLKYPAGITGRVCELISRHMYDLKGEAKETSMRRRFCAWGEDFVRELAQLRIADERGSGMGGDGRSARRWLETLANMVREGAPFSYDALHATGDDIMRWLDIPPGEAVGAVKAKLLAHCACRPGDNTPDQLRRLALGMLHK